MSETVNAPQQLIGPDGQPMTKSAYKKWQKQLEREKKAAEKAAAAAARAAEKAAAVPTGVTCRYPMPTGAMDIAKYKEARIAQLTAYQAGRGAQAAVGAPYPYKFDSHASAASHEELEVLSPAQFTERYADSVMEKNTTNSNVEVAVTGRVLQTRASSWSLQFVTIGGDFADVQVFGWFDQRFGALAECSDQEWVDMFGVIARGDIVGIVGHPARNKSGALVIVPTRPIEVLTPCLTLLPSGPYCLVDPELRSRQRHLDLVLRSDSRRVFVARSKFISAVRQFMESKNFLEVETPILNAQASGAHARPFETFHNELKMPMTLRIAPELYLKELTVGGLDRVFEIGRNFRNEGIDSTHNPEFTAMEFYWAYADYKDMIKFCKELLQTSVTQLTGGLCVEHWRPVDLSAGALRKKLAKVPRSQEFHWVFDAANSRGVPAEGAPFAEFAIPAEIAACLVDGRKYRRNELQELVGQTQVIDFTEFKEVSMLEGIADGAIADAAELFAAGKIDAAARAELERQAEYVRREDPGMSGPEYAEACQALIKAFGIDCPPPLTVKRLLDHLCEYFVEDRATVPTFVMHHPVCMSPLAKPHREDPRLTERFELLVGGFEVCNAYTELNDPKIQRRNFEEQASHAAQGDDEACGIDETFIGALELGLPPTTGCGFGIDRLVMLITGCDNIRDVILFPTNRPL